MEEFNTLNTSYISLKVDRDDCFERKNKFQAEFEAATKQVHDYYT